MNASFTIEAPVVSSDTTSPESILARKAKEIEAQAYADTYYDDKSLEIKEGFSPYNREAFTNGMLTPQHRTRGLLYGALVSAGFLAVFAAIFRKSK
jgi:hypothetical protein